MTRARGGELAGGGRRGHYQVQGCINGYGERCGNANLTSVIANLKLKLGIDCVSDGQLARLTEVSNFVSEVANMIPTRSAPYVGASAFAHKAGFHVAASSKTRTPINTCHRGGWQ